MSKIEDGFLENLTFDVKEMPTVYFSERKDKEELKKQYIKNTIKQSEDSITQLAMLFFSDENIEIINKQLVLNIFKATNKKYKIPFQKKDSLLTVMRYVWIQYSKNLDFDLKGQINKLNCIVVYEISPNVITNIQQQIGYIKDVEIREKIKFKVNQLPVNTRVTRGSVELPAMAETMQSLYKAPF